MDCSKARRISRGGKAKERSRKSDSVSSSKSDEVCRQIEAILDKAIDRNDQQSQTDQAEI
jgi:hypothetical protein